MINKFISSLSIFGRKATVTQAASSPAITRLISQQQKVHFAYLASLACVLGSFALCVQVFTAEKTDQKILVIDGSQTVHIGPLENALESKEFLGNLSILVNQVIFDRTPAGLGMPELAKHLFRQDALKKLNLEVESQAEEFKSKSIHQKGEALRMHTTFSGNIPLIKIEGQIICAGLFEGHPIAESKEYDLRFKLVKNPRLSQSGKYPYIVSDFNIHWKNNEI
jgi:hypothetical protein